jgi:prepilin-type N-terminal cleavage/methylation domain-containing protein
MRSLAKGFSLIEIITVIAVIGVLVAVLAPNIGSWIGKSKLRTSADELQQLLAFMKGESLSRSTTIKAEISENDNSIAIYSSNESTINCQSSDVVWSKMSRNLIFNKVNLQSGVENDDLCFFTNGSSNGGKLTLSSTHGEYEVQVLSATAFIEKRRIE